MRGAMAALFPAILVASVAIADVPEPPVDAPDDADVTFERADTVGAGSVEVEMGLRGSGGGAPRRDRMLRLRGDDLDATVREGADDPLSGAEMGGQGGLGSWRVGRVAPQWDRGWLVGSPVAPWSVGPEEGEALRSGPRGDLALMSIGDRLRIEGLAGRFAKRQVAALRAGDGPASVTLAGTRKGLAGLGLGATTRPVTAELAVGRRGDWRAEAALTRSAGSERLTLFARAGSEDFRAFLAPARSGPAQALAAGWDRLGTAVRPRARASLWRFGTGRTGARGALEVDLGLAQHAALTLGCEEQRGTRRETSDGPGMRQGWWGEWRGGAEPLHLELRVENWGRGAWGRGPVRAVTGAAFELRTPLGARLRAEHRVFRSGPGESLHVPEYESDRLVLRALSGSGERTSIEAILPGPAGRVRAGLSFTATAQRPPRTQWTIHWARRARLGVPPP
jgi:hypothetical protein